MRGFRLAFSPATPGLLLTLVFAACVPGKDDHIDSSLVSSRSYKGHETDEDSNNLVSTYPGTLGTRVDDCQTCHRGGTFTVVQGTNSSQVSQNACDYCHLVLHPSPSFQEPQPVTYEQTLNPYGAAYLAAGRNRQALLAIDGEDSDGDGASNGEEIAALKYPGDPRSRPGQPNAPTRQFTLAQIQALDTLEQFLLSNTTKQQFDTYAAYSGVKVRDVLRAAGVDLSDPAITGITLIAPDGYLKDFSIQEILNPFPASIFYEGLDVATLGTSCGFVQYPARMPAGLVNAQPIPGEQWLQLAYERDGAPMDPCVLDITAGKINGEGPYRVVVPQSVPGTPDRGSQYSPTSCHDGYDFDQSKDHNAGAMVRGVIAVRVNPLPAGYEDFDYRYGGWAFVENATLLVYGYGVK
jgi:hypothetical protein